MTLRPLKFRKDEDQGHSLLTAVPTSKSHHSKCSASANDSQLTGTEGFVLVDMEGI